MLLNTRVKAYNLAHDYLMAGMFKDGLGLGTNLFNQALQMLSEL